MLPAIINSLHRHWAALLPTVATQYPGTVLKTESLDGWCELWINVFANRPHRRAQSERIDLSITVHCFAKHRTHHNYAHELATAAKGALMHRTLVIEDSEIPSHSLGHLSITEPTLRNLSRHHADRSLPQLHQLTLSFPAVVLLDPNG